MKVKLGKHINYIGPYQIAQAILFFIPKVKDEYGFPHDDPRVHKFGEWLTYGSIKEDKKIFKLKDDREPTLLYKFCDWVHSKRERTIKVHIDPWDTWSMDHTLAYIILPMLKQLKEKQRGALAPHTDDEDVPEELRSTSAPAKENEWDTDENYFKRWAWIMNEMIWAFEQQLQDDWQEQYRTGKSDYYFERVEDSEYSEMKYGPNHSLNINYDGISKHEDRMKNGFRLFGKYYRGLWD